MSDEALDDVILEDEESEEIELEAEVLEDAPLSPEDELDALLGVDEVEKPPVEEDVELEDEEDEEEIEIEPSIYDEIEPDKKEDDDDSVLPEGWDEMPKEEQDEELFLALEDDKTWAEWRDSAEEIHGDVDREFAVDALKVGLTPEFLSQRGIYGLEDFRDKLIEEESKSSEGAIILADPTNEEELATFKEEYFSIPKSREGYDLAGLKGTLHEGDQEKIDLLLERAEAEGWTQGQFERQADYETVVKEELERREKGKLNQYRREHKEALKEIYGDNAPLIVKEVHKILKGSEAGKSLFKNVELKKLTESVEFISTIYNLLNFKMGSRDLSNLLNAETRNVKLDGKSLAAFKEDDLVAKQEKLSNMKIARSENMVSSDPGVREKYRKVWNAINRLQDEIEKRK